MKQFARKCTKCNKGMNDGYLVNDVEYYCSDECLYSVYSEDEYEDLYIEDSAYYTEWSEDDIDHEDEPIFATNGSLPIESPLVEKIIYMLKGLDVDGETMEYIIRQVGMEDQMVHQLTSKLK
jgi:hypothetical protein